MTMKQKPGPTTGITGIISLCRRLGMWARTQRPLSTPTHEAEASYDEPQRESQAPQALDRIKRIMERMERQQAAASSASSAQLQAFISQGELFSLILLNF
jgi:hypothetical protein